MSPPTGTSKPSGSSQSQQRRRDERVLRLYFDLNELEPEQDDEVAPTARLPASADHSQPLSASPVMGVDVSQECPAKNRPTSFDHLAKSQKFRCAVKIDRNEIMGNPFKSTKGYDVKVALDAGKSAQPSIGLNFKFAKDGINSDNGDYSFAVGWEPGVEMEGKWMIDDIEIVNAASPEDQRTLPSTFPPAIRELLDEVPESHRAMMASRLVCATFRSNVHKSSHVQPEWALALPEDAADAPYANLERMFDAEEAGYQVTMWFMNRDVPLDEFYSSCLIPLADAVAEHTPPFHQCLYENDEPFMDYRLPTIHEIGNGMYRRYPKVVDYTNKRIENRSVNPTCFNLPKLVTWDSIKTYYTGVVGPDIARKHTQPFPHAQIASRKRVSRTSPRDPTKAQTLSVEIEMLRLKDRYTLHRLAPS